MTYNSVHGGSFKTAFDPSELRGSTHQFSLYPSLKDPGDYFRLFIPPGTVIASIYLRAVRDARIAVAARMDHPPQCSYATSTSITTESYIALPWDPELINLAPLRSSSDDHQRKNQGGTCTLMNNLPFGTPLSESQGGWVFMRALKYSSHNWYSLEFSFTVDLVAYKKWYENAEWSGGDPALAGGTPPALDDCGFGEIDTEPADPNKPDPEYPNPFEKLLCLSQGGKWIDGVCVMEEEEEPEPEYATFDGKVLYIPKVKVDDIFMWVELELDKNIFKLIDYGGI